MANNHGDLLDVGGAGGVGCNDGQEGLSTKENSQDFWSAEAGISDSSFDVCSVSNIQD